MSELPKGWELCQLSDVVLPVSMIGTKVVDTDREILYVDISSIDNRRQRISDPKRLKMADAPARARQIIRTGDVLFSTVRPYLKNIAPVPANLDGQIASTGFAVLRPAAGVVPAFLFFKTISRDFVTALTGEQYGVSYPAVKEQQVTSQPFALPPTTEQHRIVAKIEELFSELDASEESLTRARAQLGLYRQSLLKAAFQGTLTADWRAANPDKLETPEALLARIRKEREDRYRQALEDWQTALSEWRAKGEEGRKPQKPGRPADLVLVADSSLPQRWVCVKVEGVLSEPLSNGRSVKDRKGGFPVLRLSAFRDGRLDLSEKKDGDWNAEEAEPWIVKEGDFFAARGNGSKHLVGIGALALNVELPVAYPDTMIRLSVDRHVIEPEYFGRVWNSRVMRDQIERAARTTAGIYKINQPHICGFLLPLPSISEQGEIIARIEPILSQIEHQERDLTDCLAKIAALRQSILKKAFAGELVPQDPADEPAAALLARIREEREPSQTIRKRRNVS